MKKINSFLLCLLLLCFSLAIPALSESRLLSAVVLNDTAVTQTQGGDALGTLKKGERVIVVGEWGKACFVIAPEKHTSDGGVLQGYCDGESIAVYYNGVVKTRLNVRSKPSTKGDIVGVFEKDANVTLIGQLNGNWYAVKGADGNGKEITGYCHGKYIDNKGAVTAKFDGEIAQNPSVGENGAANQPTQAVAAESGINAVFGWIASHWQTVAVLAVALIVVIVIICKVKGGKKHSSYSKSSYTPSYSRTSSSPSYSGSSYSGSSSSYSGSSYSSSSSSYSGSSSSYSGSYGSSTYYGSDLDYYKNQLQGPCFEARGNLKAMLASSALTYDQKQELVRYHNNHHLDSVQWDLTSGYSNIYDSGYSSSSSDTSSCGCSTGGASCGCGIDGGGGGGSTSCGCGADDGGTSCGCGADTSCGGCGAGCGCGAD